jgi:hypothetical protein
MFEWLFGRKRKDTSTASRRSERQAQIGDDRQEAIPKVVDSAEIAMAPQRQSAPIGHLPVVWLKCPTVDCEGRQQVALKDGDQPVYCRLCGHGSTFFRLVVVRCPRCASQLNAAIGVTGIATTCGCGGSLRIPLTELTEANPVTPFRLSELDDQWQGCALDAFEGAAPESIASTAFFESMEQRHPGSSRRKSILMLSHAMKIDGFPVASITLAHGACNFYHKSGSHQNHIKWLASIASWQSGQLIANLVEDYSLVDVWVVGSDLLTHLRESKCGHKYSKLLRAVPEDMEANILLMIRALRAQMSEE